jgi:hypothetical protein
MDKDLDHWTKLGAQYQKQFEKERAKREKEKEGLEWKILEKELEKMEDLIREEVNSFLGVFLIVAT